MIRVALASLPASYERRSPNIRQSTADLNRRLPSLSSPAPASPGAFAERREPAHATPGAIAVRREPPQTSQGAFAVRREPPHSCGGGALQRSEKASQLMMRFSAGPFGPSPSSRSTPKPSTLINRNSPAASNGAQSNGLTNCPFLDLKISKNLSAPPRKVFRLEPTPILCFHRLTINFNRTLVSVRYSKLGSVIKLDPFQRIQIQLENARPATNLAAVGARLAAPAPSKPRRVNQSHG